MLRLLRFFLDDPQRRRNFSRLLRLLSVFVALVFGIRAASQAADRRPVDAVRYETGGCAVT